jgi:hypothetical protein
VSRCGYCTEFSLIPALKEKISCFVTKTIVSVIRIFRLHPLLAIGSKKCIVPASSFMSKKGFSRKGERRRKTTVEALSGSTNVPTAAEQTTTSNSTAGKASAVITREISVQATKLDIEVSGVFDRMTRIAPVFVPASEMQTSTSDDTEPAWISEKTTNSNHRWLWTGVGAFLLFMIAMIALFHFVSQRPFGSTNALATLEVISEEYDPQSPLFIFQQNPGKAQEQCLDILRRYASAKTIEEAQPLVRSSPEIKSLLQSSWQPWPIPPILDDNTCVGSFDETSGRAYFILEGSFADGKKFTTYFVSQGNSLVLDWEATTGHCDMALSEFLKHPPATPVKMRLALTPSPYYMPSLSEKDYESYRLQDIQNDTYAWGYVARNSPAHQHIQSILQSGSVLLEQLPEAKATVKLQKINQLNRENQFFITDVLHKGWVMP